MNCFISLMFIVWLKLQMIFWFKIRNVEGILGGKLANAGQFKYMVSVQLDGEHICGGAIVSPQHVATAAHCFFDNDNNFINKRVTVVGRTVNLVLDKVPWIEVGVSAIYLSKEYVRMKRVPDVLFYEEIGDLAILELKELLLLGEHLEGLQLPKRDGNCNQSKYVNVPAILTGFGQSISPGNRTRINQGFLLIPNEGVRLRFMETFIKHKNLMKNYFPIVIDDKYIIAISRNRFDNDDRGACNGDDGSPLVYDGMLIGVLAQHRDDCIDNKHGSIYTRVSEYKRCILATIDNKSLRDSCMIKYIEIISNSGQIKWQMVPKRH